MLCIAVIEGRVLFKTFHSFSAKYFVVVIICAKLSFVQCDDITITLKCHKVSISQCLN